MPLVPRSNAPKSGNDNSSQIPMSRNEFAILAALAEKSSLCESAVDFFTRWL
jgi:hypothetical protein